MLSEELKELESRGWLFEAADASLELLMRRAGGWTQDFFEVEAYRVTSYHREGPVMPVDEVEVTVEATVKLWIDGERIAAVGEGNGPVNALDVAVRAALNGRYPALERIHLTDFKVRVLDGGAATGAVVRVLIDSTDGDDVWTTVGVDTNIIEASWRALIDSFVYGLLHTGRRLSDDGCSGVRPPSADRQAPRLRVPAVGRRGVAGRSAGRAGRPPAARAPARLPRSRPGLRHQAGHGFDDRLVLTAGEHEADVKAGCTAVALKRASLFGRAPMVHDLTVAFTIWGFLAEADAELVRLRKPLFEEVSSVHHYMERRKIADLVPQAVLKLSHQEIAKVAAQDWRAFFKRRSAAAPAQAPAPPAPAAT